MLTSRVIVRTVLQELRQCARLSTVDHIRPTSSPQTIALCVHQSTIFTPSRLYATDAAGAPQGQKKGGRPKGSSIANGASPKTKKTTTTGSKSRTPKASGTPKSPKKVVLSEHDKMLKKVKDLKQAALLDQPKGLPTNGWLVYFIQNHVPVSEVKALSNKFNDLPQSEKDHLANIAKANHVANQEAFKTWVESHTVEEIHKANAARRALKKLAEQPIPEGRKQSYVSKSGSYRRIDDVRATKRPDSAYITYVRERFATGEFVSTVGPVAMKTIGDAWKQLSAEEKQAYKERAPSNIGKVTVDV